MNRLQSSFVSPSPLDTPYKKARQEWDLRLGTATIQALNWRRAAFALAGIVLLSVVGLIYLGAQPKAEPYLIQVDKLGAATCLGRIERSGSKVPPPASVRYHLRRFIESTRGLSADPAVLKDRLLDAYKFVTPAGANQLNTWLRDHDPMKRVGSERVSVEVAGILPLSADTWQSDWTETAWDDAGAIKSQIVWRGTFHVLFQTAEAEEDIVANPIGMFIDEFHWAQLHVLDAVKAP